ncbi:MAG: HU family DNA-binding protein [Tannerellaceae bacterium]|jgi:predicted histone-like DNA-binding protein|nr:HU family DNA-binding protein [Tannerellaceae bacterium]
MAIGYSLVLRRNLTPGAAAGAKLFYAQTKASRVYSFDEICEDATDTSTLSSGDLKLALDRVVKLMVKSLRKGEVVHLGELGNFQLLTRSKGAETKEEFTQANLKTPRLLFRPGAKLREAISITECERATTKDPAAPATPPCERPHAD